MTHRKSLKRALSLLCVLCLTFSMLESIAFAVAADEAENRETIAEQTEVIAAAAEPDVQSSGNECFADESAEKASGCEDAEAAEGGSEEPSQESDGAAWNNAPITGQSVSKGITVFVSAPEGSFPEGTRALIKALSPSEAAEKADAIAAGTEAVAFDISFLNTDGIRIQPSNGKTVSVSFSVPAGSAMAADENDEVTFKVYHQADDGAAEMLKSYAPPDAGSTATISVEASSFSVYLLSKESAKAPILRTPGLRAVQDDVITEITALLQDGSGPVGNVGQWQVFRLNAKFELPNGQVHGGDTTTITLPEKLRFDQTAGFEIKDDVGNVIANAVIDGSAKTITLTYTNYVDSHSDVSGSFYFYVKIDRSQVDVEEDIPLYFNVGSQVIYGGDIHFVGIPDPTPRYLSKSGYQVGDTGRELRFQLTVNTKKEAINNLVITDEIQGSQIAINPSSIQIIKGNWVVSHGDFNITNSRDVTAEYQAIFNGDNTSFTLNLGNISEDDGFLIYYNAVTEYDLVDGEVIRNNATMTGNSTTLTTQSATATYYEAGGSAEGYVYTINIHKVGEDGASLAGAIFNVVRVANGAIVGTITTDVSGRGSVSGLLKDAYQIVEVSPPQGYVLTAPVDVDPDDFGSDKAVLKTITNELEKTSITVSKIWNDADNQDGIRPLTITVKLLANDVDTGKTVELSAANNWTDIFTDLDEYKDGEKIIYKVEEVDITGYSSITTGDAETGFTITNTHEPELTGVNGTKTWDDNDNQDGARPREITIRLLAGGAEIDNVTVTEADNWSWGFTNLPKYENEGTEIVYSITEDAVTGYTPDYNGYDVTNHYTPGKTSVTVSKRWNDADNQDGIRPLTITVKLLANDVDTGNTVELSAADNWTALFTDLDEYQNGHKVIYKVEETDVTGYSSVISGDADTGYAITNTHDPNKTNVAVTKVWKDQNNRSGDRPDSITIRLMADGVDTGKTLTLNANNKWAGSYSGLDQYRNGKEIVYAISEDTVAGYSTSITGDMRAGFIVTNTKKPTPTPPSDTPKTGDNSNILLYLLLMLISGGSLAFLLLNLRRKRKS